MYHFTADQPPEPVRLSFRALIPGHIRQYLKDFQLEAIRFMHNFLAKREFCIYNDESGLGKQAAVVVLLDAACKSRKCLIVVQNDDRYVGGWEFHFKVLTNSNVHVIKDRKDSTDSPQNNIYIAKWSTLRMIDDLAKLKFDFIILDNRGQMLSNSFCTSMLLKHYERKINILISSVDITSDLKLLHNVLRLGDRLEPQYSNFKVFEEKFKLPDAKELLYKRVDLEEYFCKRERLANYCKAFRLRRYSHQFETQLPLVKQDRYKINLELWREKQYATNSESSSIEYVNHNNPQNEQIKDTQELFEEYCRQRKKQHLQFQKEEEQRLHQREQRDMLKGCEVEKQPIYNVDDEVASITETALMITDDISITKENSEEQVLMSPLLVESDSDADDHPELCNPADDLEIIDLASEENEEEKIHKNLDREQNVSNSSSEQKKESGKISKKYKNKSNKRLCRKRTELDRLEEDIVDTLKIKDAHKRSRHAKEAKSNRLKYRLEEKRKNNNCSNQNKKNSLKYANNAVLSIKKEHKTPEKTLNAKSNVAKNVNIRKGSVKTVERILKENCTTPTNEKLNCKSSATKTLSNFEENEQNTSRANMAIAKIDNTPLTSRKTRPVVIMERMPNNITTNSNDNQVKIKQEPLVTTPKAKKYIPRNKIATKANSEKLILKRELEIALPGIHLTRSMQRLTRSAGSKFITKNLSLQIDKKVGKSKKKLTPKEASKTLNVTKKMKDLKEVDKKQAIANKKLYEAKLKATTKNSQTAIISQQSSQDYESLQCAQRLSDINVFDPDIEKDTQFLVPPTPYAIGRNSFLSSSLISSTGVFSESDVIFIPPSNLLSALNKKLDHVVLLSSSDNENSTSQSSSIIVATTSRRTRALKPKRNQQQQSTSENSKVPNFSNLLAHQNTRLSAKSPDLFSNCSDLIQLPCTQKNLDNEEPTTPFEGFKIFGSEVKQLQQHYAFNKNYTHQEINSKKSFREQRSCLDILEKMFEPSNKRLKVSQTDKSSMANKKSYRNEVTVNKQKVHTQILPSHPVDAISEARHQQEIQKRKRSITSTSSGLLQDDDIFEITNNGTFGSVMRLHSNGDISPVQNTQKVNSKQHNKITNYLIGNAIQNGSQEEVTPNSGNSTGNCNGEAGTPSKKYSQFATVQNSNSKKSPKSKCNTTQSTKLTKWFTKPSELSGAVSAAKPRHSNLKKASTKKLHANREVDLTQQTASTSPTLAGKRILKRRRLDLAFSK